MGRFLPPDHDAGDANTIGGYHAVHARPAAFEGKDGRSYSVEIVVDDDLGPPTPYGGYLFFVRWAEADTVAAGHLETSYLAHATSDADVRAQLGALLLSDAKRLLDALIDRAEPSSRPWYEVMRDDG
jgi:hypothetical protein